MKHYFFLSLILSLISVASSFAMPSNPDDSEVNRITTTSLHAPLREGSLDELKTHLPSAIRDNNCHDVIECYKRFKTLDIFESDAFQTPVWGPSSDDKSRVGAQLFFDAALNMPHQHLLRQAVRPLGTARPDEWEKTYIQCLERMYTIIKDHVYFHLPARAYAMAISGSYGNRMAQLFTLEFLRFLNEKAASSLLRKGHLLLSESLSKEENARQALQTFLIPDTRDYVDLQEKDFNSEEALKRMVDLGLPRYQILLGDYYFRTKAHHRLSMETSRECIDLLLKHFQKGVEEGDPTGYLGISGTRNSTGTMGVTRYHATLKTSFLRGCFDTYERLAPKDRKELKRFTEELFINLKLILKQSKY